MLWSSPEISSSSEQDAGIKSYDILPFGSQILLLMLCEDFYN